MCSELWGGKRWLFFHDLKLESPAAFTSNNSQAQPEVPDKNNSEFQCQQQHLVLQFNKKGRIDIRIKSD